MMKTCVTCNVLFYVGVSLMFRSATSYTSYGGLLEVGSVLTGIGVAGTVNTSVLTKFSFYSKWKCNDAKRGIKTATYLNIAMGVSAITGIDIASVCSEETYDIQVFIGLAISFIFTIKALITSCIIGCA